MHVYPTFVANNALLLLALTTVVVAIKYVTSMVVSWCITGRCAASVAMGCCNHGHGLRRFSLPLQVLRLGNCSSDVRSAHVISVGFAQVSFDKVLPLLSVLNFLFFTELYFSILQISEFAFVLASRGRRLALLSQVGFLRGAFLNIADIEEHFELQLVLVHFLILHSRSTFYC